MRVAMSVRFRERRVANEWKLLQGIAQMNEGLVEILGRCSKLEDDVFRVVVHQTCGIISLCGSREFAYSHVAEVHYTRFFPSVPIEVCLQVPVFHPNVDPGTGFICLWNRFSPGDTVLEALARLQHVITWSWVNLNSPHLMQPVAVQWLEDPGRQTALPLSFKPITRLNDRGFEGRIVNQHGQVRRRLEPVK